MPLPNVESDPAPVSLSVRPRPADSTFRSPLRSGRLRPTGRRSRRLALALIVSMLGLSLWLVLHGSAGVFFNVTTSLPSGVYHLRDATPAVGRLVMACLEEEASALSLARSYIGRGDCPYGTAPVAKVVAAVGGDTVRVSRAGVTVRGRLLANSAPREVDSQGHPLPDVRGTYLLALGDVWLYSGYNPKSFDSRYYGPLPDSLLLGEAAPLWTWGRPYDPIGALGLGGTPPRP